MSDLKKSLERAKPYYNPYDNDHDPKSNTCPCCVYDEAVDKTLDLVREWAEKNYGVGMNVKLLNLNELLNYLNSLKK